jgi:DNA polymerase I-like protein with 3'-5' exonuclease and polymerase domains
MQLKPYEFLYESGVSPNFDPLSFTKQSVEVPLSIQREYTKKLLSERRFKVRQQIKDELKSKGIKIKDNTKFIADATRQCVNARVQGSAADMTKKVMIAVRNDKILQDLDFHLILQVHDELIGECPRENAKQCSERLSYLMVTSAKDKISIPMRCDPSITERWYGEEINL